VRAQLATLMGRLGSLKQLPLLLQLYEDHALPVRAAAATALSYAGLRPDLASERERIVGLLRELEASPNEYLSRMASLGVLRLGGKDRRSQRDLIGEIREDLRWATIQGRGVADSYLLDILEAVSIANAPTSYQKLSAPIHLTTRVSSIADVRRLTQDIGLRLEIELPARFGGVVDRGFQITLGELLRRVCSRASWGFRVSDEILEVKPSQFAIVPTKEGICLMGIASALDHWFNELR